jgi:hypothetical protein
MSEWVYDRARATRGDDGPSGGQYVRIGPDDARLDQTEAAEFMLCEDCERRFGRRERYVSGVVAQEDGSFPALRLVRRLAMPAGTTHRAATAGDLDAAALGYFALSVFWRASVSTWFEEVTLGPYEAPIASHLLHGSPVPGDVALLVRLLAPDTDVPLQGLLTDPVMRRGDGHNVLHVVIFGVDLILFLGPNIPAGATWLCHLATGRVLISRGDDVLTWAANEIVPKPPRGALARWMAGVSG